MTVLFSQTGLYQKRRMWVLIGMLLLVVIIPTVCLLWFVSEAVRNERMAVRQKLTEVYQSQLNSLPPMLQKFWEQKIVDISRINGVLNPVERFNEIIKSGIADSVILYNDEGELLYPVDPIIPTIDFTDLTDEWEQAEQLEFRESKYLSAARKYAEIAERTQTIHVAGRALQGQVRCLGRTVENRSAAVAVIIGTLSNPIYNSAMDRNGRLILPDAQLFALQLMNSDTDPEYQKVLESLTGLLKNYSKPVIPTSQRLFLMEALRSIDRSIEFPTLDAEKLALTYRQLEPPQTITQGLSRVPESDLYQIGSSDRSVIVLFRHDRIVRETRAFINSNVLYTDAHFTLIPKNSNTDPKPLLRIAAGNYLPEWELVVNIEGDDLFTVASKRQISVYIWTALLIIIGILILAIITARLFIRQMSLTRLKNDLITTVSHELKTPLASTRVLVDTLIDRKYKDENLVKSYIDLIAKENERLSRLVENFLTFSRIEEKRQTFDFKKVEPEKIAGSAYDTMKHRFDSGGFSFELTISKKIPTIMADQDALVMVLLNLLDNAFQYSDKFKSVSLAVYSETGYVCFEVRDRGIGLFPEEKKKILKPFYQIDQTLSRKGSGFGLGLNIVKSIVDVHNGTIEIQSEPGKGSMFTVKVPVRK